MLVATCVDGQAPYRPGEEGLGLARWRESGGVAGIFASVGREELRCFGE